MARRRSPLMQQVKAESQLRYGNSLADILSARRLNYHEYRNTVRNAEDVAHAVKQGARQSVRQLQDIYNYADETRDRVGQAIDAAAGVAGGGSALAAALMGERAATTETFARERASAQAEAVARGQDATAGLVFTKRNALQSFRDTRAGLLDKKRDIRREQGAFEQGRLGEIQADAEKQARDDSWRRGIDPDTGMPTLDARKKIAALTGKDPVTGKPIPGSRNTRGNTKSEERQIRKDTAQATEEIKKAQAWIKQLRSKGGDDKTIVGLLTQGGSLPTTVEYQGRNAKGEKVAKVRTKDIAVPDFSPDYVRAALELEDLNYVSKKSVHNLRTRGIRVPKEWLPPTPGQFGPH